MPSDTSADLPPDFSRDAVLLRLIARLPDREVPVRGAPARPLAALTTRDGDDPMIALLDAWAAVVDVLAFYADRIAAEGYLPTATEDRSLHELASTVGYRRRPGLAASAPLAVTVATQPGLGEEIDVPVGTRVQANPGPDGTTAIFETIAPLTARPAWNRLSVGDVSAAALSAQDAAIALESLADLRVGDRILVTSGDGRRRFAPAVAAVFPVTPGSAGCVVRLPSRLADADALDPAPGSPSSDLAPVEAPGGWLLPTRARLYGYDAPPAEAGELAGDGGLYRYHLDDGTWTRLQGGLPGAPVAIVTTGTAAEGSRQLVAVPGHGLWRSADGGMTWRAVAGPAAGGDVSALAADPGGVLFAGGDDGVLHRSLDDGDSWQLLSSGSLLDGRAALAGTATAATAALPRSRIRAIAAVSGQVLVGTDSGVFASTDGGTSWTLRLPVAGVRALAVTDAGLLAATTTPGQITRAGLFGGTPLGVDQPPALAGRLLRALGRLPVAAPSGSSTDPAAAGTSPPAVVGTDDLLFPSGPEGAGVPLPAPGVLALAVPDDGTVLVAVRDHPFPDADRPALTASPGQDWVDLDRVVGDAGPGRWLVLARGDLVGAWPIVRATVLVRADLGPATSVSRLQLGQGPDLAPFLGGGVRATEAFVSGSALPLRSRAVAGSVIPLAGPVAALPAGRELLVTGTVYGTDRPAGELVRVAAGDETSVALVTPLRQRYEPRSVAVLANVVSATHGETTTGEVLGSGDSTVGHQSFRLATAPLSYLPAATDTGDEPALQLSVGGVPWRPVPDLLQAGPADEVYVVRPDGAGGTEVVLGDGEHGARARTGTDNVVATYRHGIGTSGNVPADALNLLQTRPLGVQTVTNPLPATGGEGPEDAAGVRRRLGHRVVTLGRLVSAADVEHFAAAFAGIAEAQAVVLTAPGGPVLHLTVAGTDGRPIPTGSALHTALVAAIEARRATGRPLVVDTFRPVTFTAAALLVPAPATTPGRPVTTGSIGTGIPSSAGPSGAQAAPADPAALATAARAALAGAFAVGTGRLGTPVRRGAVVALLQGLPGVAAVRLGALHRDDDPAGGTPALLPAARATWRAAGPVPAELLLPSTMTLTVAPPAATGVGGDLGGR
jgi:uncharacterized phage protein gp47/JayE